MKKLFTNDKFFLAMVLCAVIGNAIYMFILGVIVHIAIGSLVQLALRVLCVVGLYFSYRKHSKNVMKALMGALLMAQLTTSISLFSDMMLPIDKICIPVFAGLSLLLLLNHLIINSDHHSSPSMVRTNQVLVILLIINEVIWSGSMVVTAFSVSCLIVALSNIAGFMGLAASVVCVESRLDAYRLDREAAGWTRENGYPEGYVHECEKNQK